jgi:hypothetical protein
LVRLYYLPQLPNYLYYGYYLYFGTTVVLLYTRYSAGEEDDRLNFVYKDILPGDTSTVLVATELKYKRSIASATRIEFNE